MDLNCLQCTLKKNASAGVESCEVTDQMEYICGKTLCCIDTECCTSCHCSKLWNYENTEYWWLKMQMLDSYVLLFQYTPETVLHIGGVHRIIS